MSFRVVKLLDSLSPVIVTGGLVPRGPYNAGTTYAIGDSVDYNGSSYVLYATAVAGTLPTDTTKWEVLANKGNTGSTGPTGSPGPAGADGVVQSIIAGTNISVDSTDPANPIVSTAISQYFGGLPTVDGTWKITVSGTDLLFERRESGSYVVKGSIQA